MTKEEWLEAFEAINGRRATEEEMASAKFNGEFTENTAVVNQSSPQEGFKSNLNEPTKATVFCTSCGSQAIEGVQFCQNCGERLEGKSYASGNLFVQVQKTSILDYLMNCIQHKRWILLIYLAILSFFQYGIPILLMMFAISKTGQGLVCRIIGARKIERQEQIEYLKVPIDNMIAKARSEGLLLPEIIDIHTINSDVPVAYAVGMNKLVVSESLAQHPEIFESKVMFELHRISDMAPNLLLVVLSANIIVVLAAIVILIWSGLNKNYGDRRTSFWSGTSQSKDGAIIFYVSLAIIAAWVGLTYLFVRSTIKKDVLAADQYVAEHNLGEVHCYYLDNITSVDNSRITKFFERGFPAVSQRIGFMQNMGVTYNRAY
ncbi:Uncharacterised protein [Streptococcus criceti]|uniref:Zinc-ribbon domain-containing protein n=1 Tax=Streptococcus criceti HS-6 TaxID=873449 RepID=G5JRD7_STRCG|nr:zinc ribbon domain-containing protein [Streptococcus criceti]EHI73812.1 hypothetical protein STRCR_0724 [Streptococcus criceti HS-6]SUN43741.1 Uncharacterised protein [Streptococcus criceti]